MHARTMLQSLGAWVGALVSLSRASLRGNRLALLPEEMAKLPALAELDVR